MALSQSVNFLQQQRVDIVDLKSLESGVIFDFKTLIQTFAGENPYILQGFTIPVNGISGPATSLQLVVDSGIVWIPDNLNGSFLRVQSGTANAVINNANPNVIGSFSPGANYVGLQFVRAPDPTTADLVSFWDVDSKAEFTKTVPRGLVLNYQIVISNTDFGATAPIAIVNVSGSNVTSIENAKDGLFRLGRGGANPNPNYSYVFSPAVENPLIATSNASPDPFSGGDWDLKTFKDWMDAVMTMFKTLSGSEFWYESSSSISGLNLSDLYDDSIGSIITGSGEYYHSSVTPGLFSWTSPFYIRSIIGPRTYKVAADTVTLADQQVAYLTLVRNVDFQASNVFSFTSGSTTITSTLSVTGIVAGDYIKFVSDDESAWRQVQSISGTNITLTLAYPNTRSGKGIQSQYSYPVGSVQVADPQNVPASMDTYWIAKRDDHASFSLTATNIQRTSNVATITTSTNHNLVVGQYVTTSAFADTTFNGNWVVATTPTATTFTFQNNGTDVASTPVSAGIVTNAVVLYLRQFGTLFQGENIAFDGSIPEQFLLYVGAPNQFTPTPFYDDYNTDSLPLPNYESVVGENLTSRISRLTALMADSKQNFDAVIDPGVVSWDGVNLGVTGAEISLPGDDTMTPLPISTFSGTLTDGQCAYVTLTRGSVTTLSLTVASMSFVTPTQAQLIVVRRLGNNIFVGN